MPALVRHDDAPDRERVFTIARICHEANRAYCVTLGDHSQLPWEEAPEWQCESARNGVSFHLARLRSDPEASHANWLDTKEADGWVYGKVKSADMKTHPCVVPYDRLPEEQRKKDDIFCAIVDAFRP